MADRRVLFALYPHFQPLDVTGPHEVFDAANLVLDHQGKAGPRYCLETVVAGDGSSAVVRSTSGLGVVADHVITDPAVSAAGEPVHTLVIPGGFGATKVAEPFIEWCGETGRRAERVVTVCSGTFVAAAAGLCSGKRVTTHWDRAGELAGSYPDLTVDPDPIFICDGSFWSSAGVTSGIDLALALVEADYCADVARVVARQLVVYLRRPGGQSQFATPVWAGAKEGSPIGDACDIIHAELAGDLSVEAIARRVGMSPRNFTRRFRAEIGEPVGRHVERLRVEAARHVLETEPVGLEIVAGRCGFASTETLRRAFHRRLDLSPDAYRRSFTSSR